MAESPKKRGLELQWQMLIGFLVGLVGGLIVYSTQRGAPWVEAVTTCDAADRAGLPAPDIHARPAAALFRIGGRHFRDEGGPVAETRGLRTLAYTVVVSSIAVAVSLAVVNLFKPGAGVDRAAADQLLADQAAGSRNRQRRVRAAVGIDAFIHIIPNNLIEVMGSNSAILSVMFFALFFGIGLLLTDTPAARTLQRGSRACSTSR